MPLKFWDEAFLTTTYLINMLPSKPLKFETPTEKLLHFKPKYDSLSASLAVPVGPISVPITNANSPSDLNNVFLLGTVPYTKE
jgi:hypothetical protein